MVKFLLLSGPRFLTWQTKEFAHRTIGALPALASEFVNTRAFGLVVEPELLPLEGIPWTSEWAEPTEHLAQCQAGALTSGCGCSWCELLCPRAY